MNFSAFGDGSSNDDDETPPKNRNVIQSASDFDIQMDVSSIMQDDEDDDDMSTPSRHSAAASSHYSSSSSITPVHLLPKFERALEEARRVIFHPATPKVQEFDWKVDFTPTTTAGHKRKLDAEMEEDAPSIVSDESSSRSSQRASFKKALGFWRNLSSKSKKSEDGTSFSGKSSADGGGSQRQSSSKASQWSQSTIARDDSSSSGTISIGSDNNLFARSRNPFSSSYTRPAKRTKVEATYHLGPSSENGILLNRTSSPDAIMPNESSKRRRGGEPIFGSPISRSTPQQSMSIVTPSPPHSRSHSSRRNQRRKQIRFVDSRIKSVKSLQSGNLFSFGNRLHQDSKSDDTVFNLQPRQAQSNDAGPFGNTMAEF